MGRCHCCFWPKQKSKLFASTSQVPNQSGTFFLKTFFGKSWAGRGSPLSLDFARMHRELGLSCLIPLPKVLFEVFFSLIFTCWRGLP